MPEIDLSALTDQALVATFLFFATLDTGAAWIIALLNKNFNAAYALDFLRTHIAKVGGPILGLIAIGHGISVVGVPPIPFARDAAIGYLVIYVGVTIVSIKDSWGDKAVAPTPTMAIAPTIEPVAEGIVPPTT